MKIPGQDREKGAAGSGAAICYRLACFAHVRHTSEVRVVKFCAARRRKTWNKDECKDVCKILCLEFIPFGPKPKLKLIC